MLSRVEKFEAVLAQTDCGAVLVLNRIILRRFSHVIKS